MTRRFWSHWFQTKTALPGPPPLDLTAERANIHEEMGSIAADVASEQLATLARQNLHSLLKLNDTEYCQKCGGLYDSGFLTTTLEVKITINDQGKLISGGATAPPPHFVTRSFCKKCKPESNIILVLQTPDGGMQDTKRFDLTELYFKELDADGELLFPVSLEEHNHIFCTGCGEQVSNLTKCSKCRAKKSD